MKDKAKITDRNSFGQQGEAQEAINRPKTMILRDKAKYLLDLGISVGYMRLLLKQKSITQIDKKYIEDLYKAIT
jgi:hypothetical protein